MLYSSVEYSVFKVGNRRKITFFLQVSTSADSVTSIYEHFYTLFLKATYVLHCQMSKNRPYISLTYNVNVEITFFGRLFYRVKIENFHFFEFEDPSSGPLHTYFYFIEALSHRFSKPYGVPKRLVRSKN